MKIVNCKLLAEFRGPGCCEACRKPCVRLFPHHIFTRGAGQVDIRENLISLCLECHAGFHSMGSPSFTRLLKIAADREKSTPNRIRAMVFKIRRDQSEKVRVIQ